MFMIYGNISREVARRWSVNEWNKCALRRVKRSYFIVVDACSAADKLLQVHRLLAHDVYVLWNDYMSHPSLIAGIAVAFNIINNRC